MFESMCLYVGTELILFPIQLYIYYSPKVLLLNYQLTSGYLNPVHALT